MIKATRLFLTLPVLAAVASSIDASEKSPGAKRAAMPYVTVLAASFQQNRNAINGLITDTSNRPLNRIRVELLDDVEMAITQTYTDTTGRYSFRGLSTGTFI
ncbi:MAG TPA: carboxypeptidase-like regulatory domain-containing protein, partial [Blastocatellia bacterium]|nr:carboxypeptidase-like regulatory domain-containing protein [Blastocatellia bacterium]